MVAQEGSGAQFSIGDGAGEPILHNLSTYWRCTVRCGARPEQTFEPLVTKSYVRDGPRDGFRPSAPERDRSCIVEKLTHTRPLFPKQVHWTAAVITTISVPARS